jgi:glycyl-tRNA synthetase beta chain
VPADLLLELGGEELPASFIAPALEQLAQGIATGLAAVRLQHGRLERFGTPRRLAVLAREVGDRGEHIRKEMTGPPVKVAFKDGQPTVAATRFAQSLGLAVSELGRVTTPKGEYLAATIEETGKRAIEALPPMLGEVVRAIKFPKSMRWGEVELTWGRPLHWIVALLGAEVLPLVYADVRSGRHTRGHRFLAPGPIELAQAGDYPAALEGARVIADVGQRRALVAERVRQAATRAGGALLEDEALLDQVTNLVELPCPVVGRFDERHLDLPPEVLVQEMKSHQRYFSIAGPDGRLRPRFIAVSNTPVRDEALSVRGYERVLEARLSDGRFFFDEDRKTPLADQVERLRRVTWQNQLGSYHDKLERFRPLALWLARQTGHADRAGTLERAALLAKADLVTGMVGEFPDLQGVMGREYALASGEPPEVAAAIFEHYLPRNAGDQLAATEAGALLGIADRLDTVVGIFGIGKGPTGAADPFGLRRAALAVIHLVLGRRLRFDLGRALEESLALYRSQGIARGAGGKPFGDAAAVREFFAARLEALWGEQARTDLVKAVLAVSFGDLVQMRLRLEALGALVAAPDFSPLATTFKRVANIVAKQAQDVPPGPVDPGLLKDAGEQTLHAAWQEVRGEVEEAFGQDDFARGLSRLTALKPHVDAFFDQVMVMADDRPLRENRVRLLQSIEALFRRVADFAQIQPDHATP